MLRALFFTLLPFALLGDARIFLFIMNRVVFGSHRHERSPWMWLMWAVPPVLLVLTALWWPLHTLVDALVKVDAVERVAPRLAQVGVAWLVIAGGIGIYWVVDRVRVLIVGEVQQPGTRTSPSEVVRLRKRHRGEGLARRIGAHNDLYELEITKHEVAVAGLPDAFDGYRIAFLTDTHVVPFVRREYYAAVVAHTNAFDPDAILLGGDFVTWERHIPLMAEVLLTGLRARDGMFAVLGNHDIWSNGAKVRAAMEAKGVEFVVNRSIRLERGGAQLALLGIDEVYRGEPDLEAAFAGIPGGPRLGITHHPDMIEFLDGRRIDLLLCGHTHGGQIRFPFFGPVVVPSRHEGRYAAGFHRAGEVLMYVSRGIGAVPPVRILCRPELATFILRRA